MRKMELVELALARWELTSGQDAGDVRAELDAADPRFVMFEGSRFEEGYHWTWGDYVQELFDEADSDEFAEDWVPVALLDLVTAEVLPLKARRVTGFASFSRPSKLEPVT